MVLLFLRSMKSYLKKWSWVKARAEGVVFRMYSFLCMGDVGVSCIVVIVVTTTYEHHFILIRQIDHGLCSLVITKLFTIIIHVFFNLNHYNLLTIFPPKTVRKKENIFRFSRLFRPKKLKSSSMLILNHIIP